MATTLYCTNTALPDGTVNDASFGGPVTEMALSTTIGASLASAGLTTSGGGDHLPFPVTTLPHVWLYRVNAVTISGSISVKLWGYEDAMATNCKGAINIARFDGSGVFQSFVIANANAGHPAATEWGAGTPATSRSWSATPTSTVFSAGDWVGAWFHADAVGTMAAGTMTLNWNDSAANLGDTLITFTETITEYVPAAGARVPRFSPYPQLLAH